MTLKQFIRDNRAEIDEAIDSVLNYVPRTASCDCHLSGTDHVHHDSHRRNDSERRLWVLNDAGLYGMAREAGCRI